MTPKHTTIFLLSVFITSYIFCDSSDTRQLLIPVGRLIQNGNQIQVLVDSLQYRNAPIINDGCGGSWLQIPFVDVKGKSNLALTITRTNPSSNIIEKLTDIARWTSPDRLIDSDNPSIISKAKEITDGKSGIDEKASAILHFVIEQIQFKTYWFMHSTTASGTLTKGYGICVNHSRLFVAMCRAVGIPARTISGAILGEDRLYYHHEWAEFYDASGCWHSVDPTMSKNLAFKDLSRIDLLYDIESNPIYPFSRGWERDIVIQTDQSISVFCPDWGAQRMTGQMSYALLDDSSPNHVTVSVNYSILLYVQ